MKKSVRRSQISGLRVRAHVRLGDACSDKLRSQYQNNPSFSRCAVRGFPQNNECGEYATALSACRANAR